MNLAIKEIKYNKKKYILIELILILLIFMVLFLSGLANGLGRVVSASIETMKAEEFLLSSGSEDLLALSDITTEELEDLKGTYGSEMTGFSYHRSTINKTSDSEKENIIFFGIDEGSFLVPEVSEGTGFGKKEHEIILNTSFQSLGIEVGNTIYESVTGYEFIVVGFTEDAYYAHIPVGYISKESYEAMRQNINEGYTLSYNGIAVAKALASISDDFLHLTKAEVIDNLPGYSSEQMTIRMILWVLLVISAIILGIFFYILTLQKESQFGIMKAMGMRMSEINGMLLRQILCLSFGGVCFGNLLSFMMASFLPETMPFYLKAMDAAMISIIFVFVSLIFGLFSTARVAKVDPLMTIGGQHNE